MTIYEAEIPFGTGGRLRSYFVRVPTQDEVRQGAKSFLSAPQSAEDSEREADIMRRIDGFLYAVRAINLIDNKGTGRIEDSRI